MRHPAEHSRQTVTAADQPVMLKSVIWIYYDNWSAASGGSSDILTAAELTQDMDDDLLPRILWDKNHILHALLSDRRVTHELRPQSCDRKLAPKLSCLTESNFLIRQLCKNWY